MSFARLFFLLWINFFAYAEDKTSRILVLSIDSSINPATLSYLTLGYTKAKNESFDYVLITLNTPGGLVSTTKKILSLIGESAIPTVVWVFPEELLRLVLAPLLQGQRMLPSWQAELTLVLRHLSILLVS